MIFTKVLQKILKQHFKLWVKMQLHWKPLPKGKNKKVIGFMEDELGGKIKTKVVGLKVKTYSYLKDDCNENKNEKKGTKKRVI